MDMFRVLLRIFKMLFVEYYETTEKASNNKSFSLAREATTSLALAAGGKYLGEAAVNLQVQMSAIFDVCIVQAGVLAIRSIDTCRVSQHHDSSDLIHLSGRF